MAFEPKVHALFERHAFRKAPGRADAIGDGEG
jgi:hypothetical protein